MCNQSTVGCVRLSLGMFTCFYWILGLAVCINAAYVVLYLPEVSPIFSLASIANPEQYFVTVAVLFIVVAVFGAMSLVCAPKAPRMLHLYGAALGGIVLAAGLAVAILIFFRGTVDDKLLSGFKQGMRLYSYEGSDSVELKTKSVNLVQRKFGCCGVSNYTDWFETAWVMSIEDFNSTGEEMLVPLSCCKEGMCEQVLRYKDVSNSTENVNVIGCDAKIQYLSWIIEVAAISVLVLVCVLYGIGVVLACCLGKMSLSKSDEGEGYKQISD